MNIISKKLTSVVLEDGQEVSFNLAYWPEKSPGQPYNKTEVYWTGSTIVAKTQAMLDKDAALKALPDTDAKMPRVVEDLIDILVSKNVIRKSDLPQSVQDIYDQKKALRDKIK